MPGTNTTISIKKSQVSGNIPSFLANGEIAINQADDKLFYSKPSGIISYITNQQTFATVNANSSLILASSPTDTLTIIAGNNISISACTTNKTITINSTATGGGSGQTDFTNQEFIATAGQTTFNVTSGYTVGKIAVYVNGVLLSESDYTASNGATVVLNIPSKVNDIITVSKWSSTNVTVETVTASSFLLNYVTLTSNNIITSSNTANQVLDLFNTSLYRSVKYNIQVSSGSDYQSSELLLIHNDTNSYVTEYGLVYTNNVLMNYDTDINSSNARLLMSPVNNINTIKIFKTYTVV